MWILRPIRPTLLIRAFITKGNAPLPLDIVQDLQLSGRMLLRLSKLIVPPIQNAMKRADRQTDRQTDKHQIVLQRKKLGADVRLEKREEKNIGEPLRKERGRGWKTLTLLQILNESKLCTQISRGVFLRACLGCDFHLGVNPAPPDVTQRYCRSER